MFFSALLILLTANWYLLHFTETTELLSQKNQDTIVNCILQTSIKYLDHKHPIAVIPNAYQVGDHVQHTPYEMSNVTVDEKQKCVIVPMTLNMFINPKNFDKENTITVNLTWTYTMELVLRKLHTAQRWPLLLGSTNYIYPLNVYRNYIVFIPGIPSFGNILNLWFLCINFRKSARYLVVLINSSKDNEELLRRFHQLTFCFRDVLLLVWNQTSEQVDVKGTVPYTLPYGRCGKIDHFFDVETWIQDDSGGSFLKNADLRFFNVPDKLKCCNVSLGMVFDDLPPYNFRKLESNGEVIFDGIDVRLLKHINDGMVDNENCTRIHQIYAINTLQTEEINVVMGQDPYPYDSLKYTIFVPEADSYPRWAWFTAVFSTNVWISFLISLSLTALAMRCIACSKFNSCSGNYKNISYCLLNVWSIFAGVGVNKIPASVSLRTLFFSWIAFSICVCTVFQAFITSFFVLQFKERQIETLQELQEDDFTIVYDSLKKYFLNHDSKIASTCFEEIEHAFLYAINTQKTAFYSTENSFQLNMNRRCYNDRVSPYYKFKDYDDSNNYYGLMIFYDGVLQDKMRDILKRLTTTGIINKVFSDIVEPTGQKWLSVNPSILEYETMSIGYLQSCFYSLLCGVILSLIVFFMEICVKMWESKFTRHR
ncbi:Ionotropic receptor 794 [Blattella germanica]|nr:Ionotropic receptor 794 [Blattella germanica]